jgi:hypothetical protein
MALTKATYSMIEGAAVNAHTNIGQTKC